MSHDIPRRRHYTQPPILERIIEVHTPPSDLDLDALRPRFAECWPDFTVIEELPVGALALNWNLRDGAVETRHSSTGKRLRFWTPNKKRLLQVGRDLFAANDLSLEPGWDHLAPMFQRAYRDFRELAAPAGVTMAVVRYLNRVRAQKDQKAQELFTIFPQLQVPRPEHAPFQMVVDMGDTVGIGKSSMKLSFAGIEGDHAIYRLNLVVESGTNDIGDPAALFAWADRAHSRVTELFDSSITASARLQFGERE